MNTVVIVMTIVLIVMNNPTRNVEQSWKGTYIVCQVNF